MGNIQKQNILKSLSDAGKSFMNIGKQFLKQFSLKTCEKTQSYTHFQNLKDWFEFEYHWSYK